MLRIANLTKKLRQLSEDMETDLIEMGYIDDNELESDDEKLSFNLKEGQKKDILINNELLLTVNYQEGKFYSILAYNSEEPDGILDTMDVYFSGESDTELEEPEL